MLEEIRKCLIYSKFLNLGFKEEIGLEQIKNNSICKEQYKQIH